MPRPAATVTHALCLAVSLGLMLTAAAGAQNLSAEPAGSPGTAARLVIAQRAYDHALTSGDVLPLLAAIGLARSVALRPATGWVRTAAPDAPTDATTTATDPASEAALVIARNLAGDDPDLQDLVYDLDAQLPRGRLETAVTASGTLGPGQIDLWRIALSGEVQAELALIGDGQSPLGLTLADDSGAVLCVAHPSADPALCQLTPARNGFFTASITNAGGGVVSYRLIGN